MNASKFQRVTAWIKASGLDLRADFFGERVCIRDGAMCIEVADEGAAYVAISNWRGSRLGFAKRRAA